MISSVECLTLFSLARIVLPLQPSEVDNLDILFKTSLESIRSDSVFFEHMM